MNGLGTRSYNNSTEARENKRQMKAATEKYLAQPRKEIVLDGSWLMCWCDGWPWPHAAHSMREITQLRPWRRFADREDVQWLKPKTP